MNTARLMYGEANEVANELCSCNEPEDVLHVDLISAIGNALTRIHNLELEIERIKAPPQFIENTTPIDETIDETRDETIDETRECDQCGYKPSKSWNSWQCPRHYDPNSGCDGTLVKI